jgi:hypothetical protein
MTSRLVHALVALACASSGCATTLIAFSGKAVESRIPPDQGGWWADSALVVRFELVNLSRHRVTVSIWGETLRIESVTRDGRPVQSDEEFEPRWVDDPRSFREPNMRVLEADESVTFDDNGVRDLRLANDTWSLRVFSLVRGHYRVVYSYQYGGPDFGKPNVFHGRIVARPIYFTVE